MSELQEAEEWMLRQYQFGNIIGKGSRGTVFKGFNSHDGKYYAIKEVKIEDPAKQQTQKEVQKELEIMKTISHKNLIQLYDSFISESRMAYSQYRATRTFSNQEGYGQKPPKPVASQSIYLVMEYAENGDLQKLIDLQKQNRVFFAEKYIWEVGWQLCLALLHLHSHDIVHRDVKCLNILLTNDCKVAKLGDLSESMNLTNSKYAKSKRIGTPLYLSPDIIKHEPYDHRTDIWSLGVVMYHMASLEFPFMEGSFNSLMKQILYKQPKPFLACYSPSLKDFIFAMLEKNKGKRPFIIDLFKFFPHMNLKIRNEIDIENYEIYQKFKANMEKKRVIDNNKLEIKNSFEVLKQRLHHQNQKEREKRDKVITRKTAESAVQLQSKDSLKIQTKNQQYQTNLQENLSQSLLRNQTGNGTTRSEKYLPQDAYSQVLPHEEESEERNTFSPLQSKFSLPFVQASIQEEERLNNQRRLQQFIEQRTSLNFAKRFQQSKLKSPRISNIEESISCLEQSHDKSDGKLPTLGVAQNTALTTFPKKQKVSSNIQKIVTGISEFNTRMETSLGPKEGGKILIPSIEMKLKFIKTMNKNSKKISIRSISSKHIFHGHQEEAGDEIEAAAIKQRRIKLNREESGMKVNF